MSPTSKGLLIHCDATPNILTVDATSNELTDPPEFAHATKPVVSSQASFRSAYRTNFTLENAILQPYLIKIGDHLFGDDCTVSTRDGKKHQIENMLPWIRMQRFEKGFLTHYVSETKTIWYVETKRK